MARQWTAKQALKGDPLRLEPEQQLQIHPRVLLAEDQPEMRRILRRALVRDGYEVVEAEDGPSLVRALVAGLLSEHARAPELIISDVRMPGFTGLEVLARLRREDWSTPVILITAFADEAVHQEAARLGAVRVLDKPFELDELRAAVRELLKPH
jgi:two-component system response regulator (stage 0 sporulation protein F)